MLCSSHEDCRISVHHLLTPHPTTRHPDSSLATTNIIPPASPRGEKSHGAAGRHLLLTPYYASTEPRAPTSLSSSCPELADILFREGDDTSWKVVLKGKTMACKVTTHLKDSMVVTSTQISRRFEGDSRFGRRWSGSSSRRYFSYS